MGNETSAHDSHYGVVPAETALGMSGLDFMRAIQNGELPPPPITALLDYEIRAVEPGHVEFACHPHESQYNVLGVVHGGVVTTALDSAMGCAVHTLLEAGRSYTTLEVKVNFVRPVTVETGEMIASGDAIHVGRRTATAEGRLTDARGRVLAHATTTCIVLTP